MIMIGKFWIRAVGVLACVAVVASAWDAEAGWRRHHRRAACCEPVCCEPVYEPVCCEPVREVVRESVCCEPVRETVCCGETREIVILPMTPTSSCCNNQFVAAEMASSEQVSILKQVPAEQTATTRGTPTTAASLSR